MAPLSLSLDSIHTKLFGSFANKAGTTGGFFLGLFFLPTETWLPYFTLSPKMLLPMVVAFNIGMTWVILSSTLFQYFNVSHKQIPESQTKFCTITVSSKTINIQYRPGIWKRISGRYPLSATQEELLFRGYLFVIPATIFPSLLPLFAAVSIVVFTRLHRQYTRIGLIPVAGLAAMLTGVVIVTQSLISAIVVHWAINAFQEIPVVEIDND